MRRDGTSAPILLLVFLLLVQSTEDTTMAKSSLSPEAEQSAQGAGKSIKASLANARGGRERAGAQGGPALPEPGRQHARRRGDKKVDAKHIWQEIADKAARYAPLELIAGYCAVPALFGGAV
jgi:hypothetical protein